MINFATAIPSLDDSTPGGKLKYYRIVKGLSQEELGEKVGRTKWGIVNYEKGFNNIHYEDAVKLSEILDIGVDELIDEYTAFCSPGYGERIAKIRHLCGLTQEEFAKQIGATRNAVGRWEIEFNKNRPGREFYQKIKEIAESIDIDINKIIADPDHYEDEYIRFVEKDCAKKVLYIRCKYGIFQSEFAELVGLENDSVVSSWESGKTIPLRKNYSLIKSAAIAAGIDISKLNEDPDFYADEYLNFIRQDAGKKIHYLRVLYDLTEESFGQMLGCSGNTISEWESENCIPSRRYYSSLQSLARKKGINLSDWNDNPEAYRDHFLEFRGPGSCDKIKRVRKAYGMSQEKFAKLVGVSKRSVGLWEDYSKERFPSRKYYEKIKLLGLRKEVNIDDT